MEKTYLQPCTNIVQVKIENVMGAVVSPQGGVDNDSKVGRAYSSSDQDYSRQNNSFWDDGE